MGKTFNIYISDEGVIALEKKRKEKDFNLSGFVSACLIKDSVSAGESVDDLNNLIRKIRAEIQLKEAHIEELLSKIKKINEEHDLLNYNIEELKGKKEFETKMRNFWSNISEEDKKEYIEGIKDGRWHSSTEYFKIKTAESPEQKQ